jgi:hypothetical protein
MCRRGVGDPVVKAIKLTIKDSDNINEISDVLTIKNEDGEDCISICEGVRKINSCIYLNSEETKDTTFSNSETNTLLNESEPNDIYAVADGDRLIKYKLTPKQKLEKVSEFDGNFESDIQSMLYTSTSHGSYLT